ncbi:MAG: hypothetical protein U9R72_11480 [Chloroflexota bacterium]|nr:hypothetical protein [Chloroflexota bacterium]
MPHPRPSRRVPRDPGRPRAQAHGRERGGSVEDEGYYEGMVAFNRALTRETGPVWDECYQGGRLDARDETPATDD